MTLENDSREIVESIFDLMYTRLKVINREIEFLEIEIKQDIDSTTYGFFAY